MPSVAYMTIADVLFLVAYALTAVLLGVSIAAAHLHERGKELAWKWLDIVTLAAMPIAIVIVVGITVRPPPAAAEIAAKSLGGARPRSGRDVLRIGIDTLPSAMGGLAGRSMNWGTVRAELDDTRLPVLVEQVPSVTTNALSFQADGKLEVTWRLRKDLRWSDGTPLTAEDLRFALQVSPDPRIVEARVVDPRVLTVRYSDRLAVALENITPLPRHVLEPVFKKGGYDAVRDHRRSHALPSTGPYRLVDFKVDDHAILEANPHFVGPRPSIRRIEIRRYPNDAALVKAFEDKQIDLIAPNAISPEAASALRQRAPEAVKIRPSEVQMFLHPDLSNPVLAPLEVRRAILAAIDRERLRLQIFGENARVSNVPVPGGALQGAENITYDRDAARAAFERAKVLGQKVPFFHGPGGADKALAAEIAKEVAAAGLALELKEVAKLPDLYRKRKHGGLLLTSTTGERDALPEKYWSLPQVGGKFDRSFRNGAYTDAIAALVEREERALYPERRDQIRDLLFVEYSKRLPNLPLLFLADRIVAVPELRGWTEGSGINFGTSIERWYFATGDLHVERDAR
jgi:ABC-type transport system substrate-binding protein